MFIDWIANHNEHWILSIKHMCSVNDLWETMNRIRDQKQKRLSVISSIRCLVFNVQCFWMLCKNLVVRHISHANKLHSLESLIWYFCAFFLLNFMFFFFFFLKLFVVYLWCELYRKLLLLLSTELMGNGQWVFCFPGPFENCGPTEQGSTFHCSTIKTIGQCAIWYATSKSTEQKKKKDD